MKKKSLTFVTLHENTLKDVLDQCFELGVMDDCAVEGRAFSQLAYRPLAYSVHLELALEACEEYC